MPYIQQNIAKPLLKLWLGWIITSCGISLCNYAFMCDELESILPKGPYLPCVSMAGRALLAGYPRTMPVHRYRTLQGMIPNKFVKKYTEDEKLSKSTYSLEV